MTEQLPNDDAKADLMRPLAWRVLATRSVMFGERFMVSFWPALTLAAFGLAYVLWGLPVILPQLVSIIAVSVALIGVIWLAYKGLRTFTVPTKRDVYNRLDRNLSGNPVTSLADKLALGQSDADAQGLWDLHLHRMSQKAKLARVPAGHVRLSAKDPFALRLIAVIAVISGLMFGGANAGQNAIDALTGRVATPETGPSFEIWAKPPLYTGLPTVYLNDVEQGEPISMAAGSEFLIRAYGDTEDLNIVENISVVGNTQLPSDEGVLVETNFIMTNSGVLEIRNQDDVMRSWDISLLSDLPPMIDVTGELTRDLQGAMQLPFRASDDYGVTGGSLTITLNLDTVDRRYGLALPPEDVANLTGELPLPFTDDRVDFEGVVQEDFAKHVWAGLPVLVDLTATDAAGNEGRITPLAAELARKRFFDPLSAALVDVRRQLLWNRENAQRGIYLLRAITYKPSDAFSDNKAYLMTRSAIRRMETYGDVALSDETLGEVSDLLWNAAILIEDGDVNDPKERLERAQERLKEAMENGATPEEIEELMEELRQATREYMKYLSENAEESDQQSGGQQGETVTQDQIQEMMDEIQRLMDEGRMDEAQALLQELQELLENMQIVRQSGEGGEGEGDEQEQDMQDMLQEQQDLADDTFRELQRQFDQQQQSQGQQEQQQGQQQQGQQQRQDGQQQGQPQGQNGQQSQGQQGQSQQGQGGQQQGDSAQQGQQQAKGGEQSGAGQGESGDQDDAGAGNSASDLAGRQQALRDLLDQQRGRLPNDGSREGRAAGDAFDDADREMGQAEESLRQGDLGGALDQQSDALESMRRGMRALREQQRQAQNSGQGQESGNGESDTAGLDPLGRSNGQDQAGSTIDEDAQNNGIDNKTRRQQYENLLNDLKGRAQDRTRPEYELDYLERLLDRF